MAVAWQPSPAHHPDLLNPAWDLYGQLNPSTAGGENQLTAASDRLHQLELQRHLRHLSGEAVLPGIFWPVLVVGGILLVLFSYVFTQSSVLVQALTTGLLAALLCLVLLLILSLNQPFTGPVAVSQQPFRYALAVFHAMDLRAPTP